MGVGRRWGPRRRMEEEETDGRGRRGRKTCIVERSLENGVQRGVSGVEIRGYCFSCYKLRYRTSVLCIGKGSFPFKRIPCLSSPSPFYALVLLLNTFLPATPNCALPFHPTAIIVPADPPVRNSWAATTSLISPKTPNLFHVPEPTPRLDTALPPFSGQKKEIHSQILQ